MACDTNLSSPLQNSRFFLKTNIDCFTKLFDNYLFFGDVNMGPSNTNLKQFLDSNGL